MLKAHAAEFLSNPLSARTVRLAANFVAQYVF
jgi:hypothetical protein